MECDVLVIGGGATGLGVVRDAAMRGFRSVLVERVDLGQGTTGRFHGLLHSGGRYVVSDPRSASECAEENTIVRRIAAGAVEDTGGLFVTTPADDADYADRFLAGCAEAGVPAQEITTAEALAREPRVNPRISRAFEVRDAAVDAWKLLWGNAASAREHGATILTYHWVTGVLRDGDRVAGVVARDDRGGGEVRIEAGFTVNAGGIWAGEIADMADCPGRHGGPRQGDHDRDEPPARLLGGQPLRSPRRRRHPRAHPDGLRDRHDRLQGRHARRPGHPAGRGAADARRRRGPGPRLPRGARAPCLVGLPARCSRTSGRARRAATPAT